MSTAHTKMMDLEERHAALLKQNVQLEGLLAVLKAQVEQQKEEKERADMLHDLLQL